MPKLGPELEMSTKEVSYREVRGGVVAYIERRRASSTRPVPIDIGDQEEEEEEGIDDSPEYQTWEGAKNTHETEDGKWTNVAGRGNGWEGSHHREQG